jgi:hypothetical protein
MRHHWALTIVLAIVTAGLPLSGMARLSLDLKPSEPAPTYGIDD